MPRIPKPDASAIMERALAEMGGELELFAVRAGKHTNTVYRWVTGASNPSANTLIDALERNNLNPEDYGLRRSFGSPTRAGVLPDERIIERLETCQEELVRRLEEIAAEVHEIKSQQSA